MRRNNNNELLIIIVTYNAMRWIDRCIKSVQSSSICNDVYIIDNGSNDGTRQYIVNNYPNVKIHSNRENLGFGKANNFGLKYAIENKYKFVYLLNQDAWVMPDTFEKLIKAANTHPEYGILSPIQLQANCQHFDTNFGYNIGNWDNNEKLCERLYFSCKEGIYDINRVMAAHWLLTRECITNVGGFSPSFPHYGEDDNYAERTLYKGYKIGVVLDTQGVHDREERELSIDKIIYLSYIRIIILFSGWNNNLKKEFFIYTLRCIIYSIKNKTFLPIKYYIKFIKEIKEIIRNRERSRTKCAFLK